MTTGGSTRGRCTKASSSEWPTNRRRVRTHATMIASGRLNTTLRAATLRLRCSASISSGLSHVILVRHRAGLHRVRSILCTRVTLRICSMTYYRAVAHSDAVEAAPERIGVLVVNLGTPDSPTYFAVQRFLREFLGDRRVIDTSRLIWLPLLYGVVLPFRPIRTVR